jgi:predicted ABC-type transport system involved in lysophospholipase L1 biosynthesis ATPase subunit
MASDKLLLDLRGVTKAYAGTTESVLRGVDLQVKRGEAIAIVGPSGSGKSTLLNIIGTLDTVTAGTVTFDGQTLGGLGDAELARLRSVSIGFVFQSHHLLPQCSVLENVLVPTLVGPPQADAEARAARLLERVGLGHRLRHRPGQLSGGERQRAAVVRALINRPPLLLADEPTGSLDRVGSESLAALLMDLNREEAVTLIVVTHATALAGRMQGTYELRDGRLIRQ